MSGTVIDGAHVLGYNRATIGISMMGTFSGVAPTTFSTKRTRQSVGGGG
jgi:hypothetical protein